MTKFEIDERMHNSLSGIAKLLLDPDFRHPTENSSFEFLFVYSATDDRAIKVKISQGFKFIDSSYMEGIIVSLKEKCSPNQNPINREMKSMEVFASLNKYLEHDADFVEYVENVLKFFDEQLN